MQTWNTVEEFLAVPGTIPIGDMHKGQRFQAFDGRTYTRVSEHHGAVTVRRDAPGEWELARRGSPVPRLDRNSRGGRRRKVRALGRHLLLRFLHAAIVSRRAPGRLRRPRKALKWRAYKRQ